MILKGVALAVAGVGAAIRVGWYNLPPDYDACQSGNITYYDCRDLHSHPQPTAPPKPLPPPLEGVADLLRQSARAVDESRWHDDKAKLVTARTDASLAIEKINAALGLKAQASGTTKGRRE